MTSDVTVSEPVDSAPPPERQLVKVQFSSAGKVHDYDPGPLELRRGDMVIVPMSRGSSLATVVADPRPLRSGDDTPLSRVIKRVDIAAMRKLESSRERAKKAEKICAHRIRERGMPMRLIKAEPTYDGSKITFYFFAEKRVDFRDLVRDLNRTLHTRIEMKHVGNRDETKLIGGVGPCGRELCCSSWMREFSSVSVRMAKEQGLSLKPSKLAGMCGRLKCCLRYEYETYRELGRALPKVGKMVESVKGSGVVVRQNRLKHSVILRIEEEDTEVEVLLDDLVEKKPDDSSADNSD